jgi:hypothetical protein
MIYLIIRIRDWIKYRRLGLGKKVIAKPRQADFYPRPSFADRRTGVNGQRGVVIALYFDEGTVNYGIELEKKFKGGTDLSVLPFFEKSIVRLRKCKPGHGVWLSKNRIEFI